MARAILIILDGVGVGRAPDAASYGDAGSDTLGNLARQQGGLELPTLQALGLGNLHDIEGVPPATRPRAFFGRMRECSVGKDSTAGHWELMGLPTEQAFPTYPNGFPAEILDQFSERTGRGWIGNVAASGTQIIADLGDEHVATGNYIVYTSADSVFQIAAHEEVVPLEELYRACELAREILVPPHGVSRVIARPFVGSSGVYTRTPNRHDYSLEPGPGLILDKLRESGVRVETIGKIYDLYAGQGIDATVKSLDNEAGMKLLVERYEALADPGLLMLNLVDFDMLWGHRNDPDGMANGLVVFDKWLAGFLPCLADGDLLMLTADHGNDPTTPSTDHSREEVPLVVVRGGTDQGEDLGLRSSFADLGATLMDFFGAGTVPVGESFLDAVVKPQRPAGLSADDRQLIDAARSVRSRSYAPYSHFKVGAAIRCTDGTVITGTNVENASFSLSLCAERAAIVRAVAENHRDFGAIAVVADGERPTPPCGACRQVLIEFAPDAKVLLAGEHGVTGEVIVTTVRELLPHAFVDFPRPD